MMAKPVNRIIILALLVLLGLVTWSFFTANSSSWLPLMSVEAVVTPTASPNNLASFQARWPVLPGLAVFDGQLKLLSLTLPKDRFAPGDPIEVTLYWQTQTVTTTYNLFLHLVDADNQLVSQADMPLANQLCPTANQFSEGVMVTCHSLLLPPDGLAVGEYQLLVGVYDPASGRRLTMSTGASTVSLAGIRVATDAVTLAAAPLPPCPVTVPNGSTPPGEQPSPDYHGNGQLWTILWPEGTVIFEPGGPGTIYEDGSLGMKWAWWRGVEGPLTIEGRRLDVAAPPLRADIPEGYGESGFQAAGLIFPSEGCWEVTGKVGQAELTFVTLVVNVGASQ